MQESSQREREFRTGLAILEAAWNKVFSAYALEKGDTIPFRNRIAHSEGTILTDMFRGVDVRVYYNYGTGKFDLSANFGENPQQVLRELAGLLKAEGANIGDVEEDIIP